ADGQTISYDYNKLDQLLTKKTSTESEGQVLYSYDADGRRVAMSDLTGQTRYAYNEEGELTGVRQGDGSLITYTYDHAGNKLTSTETVDGKESKTEFSYDAENRLLEMKSGDKTITYTYDKNGNRVSLGEGDVKLDYIYDTEGWHILFSPLPLYT
ncbi:hypothetical protein HO875_00005, partial [Streptococcus suis]|nr:hypothetical protein [Streptococcus suis]